jgi:hypothetical protein
MRTTHVDLFSPNYLPFSAVYQCPLAPKVLITYMIYLSSSVSFLTWLFFLGPSSFLLWACIRTFQLE